MFILAALILALTLAASASRSLAASFAAMLAIVSGLCWGSAFSRGRGSLLELSVRSRGVEAGFGVRREGFLGDVDEDRDCWAWLAFEVFRRETSSSGGVDSLPDDSLLR